MDPNPVGRRDQPPPSPGGTAVAVGTFGPQRRWHGDMNLAFAHRLRVDPEQTTAHYGRHVAVFNRQGLMKRDADGYYFNQTRFLSGFDIRSGGKPVKPVSCANVQPHAIVGYYLLPSPAGRKAAPPGRSRAERRGDRRQGDRNPHQHLCRRRLPPGRRGDEPGARGRDRQARLPFRRRFRRHRRSLLRQAQAEGGGPPQLRPVGARRGRARLRLPA